MLARASSRAAGTAGAAPPGGAGGPTKVGSALADNPWGRMSGSTGPDALGPTSSPATPSSSRPAPNLGHLLRAVGVEAGLLGRRSKVTRDVGVVRHDERDLLTVGEVIGRLAEPPAERAVERPAQVEG